MTEKTSDKSLGMDRAIDRRDFLNGVAVGIGAIGSGLAGRALAQAGAQVLDLIATSLFQIRAAPEI